MTARMIRFQPLRAFKAAVALTKDPDDLPQVFTIVESLSFDSLSRIHRRFEENPHGRDLLERRPDIVAQLADREALARLPAGTVGRAYLDFVTSENISAEGIRAAAATGSTLAANEVIPEDLAYVHSRMRDTHDLWHVVTGFQGDVVGEISLLSFLFAQTLNPGIALIIFIGMFKLAHISGLRALLRTWYRQGRAATWLPSVQWEELLARPLADVRRELGITQIARYTPVRSSELPS